jgi:hypothetical protein
MSLAPAVVKIDYTPPPTIRDFIKDYRPGELFYDWIVGPVGSGKTTGIFFKLAYMAGLQAKGPDGIRRSRAVVVRNTMPQLKDTTLKSWGYWFKDGQAGTWRETDKIFRLRFGDVDCEVLFRALDTAEDINRVLSLEVTFAILDEFVQIPKEIIDALSARCGRYPSAKDGGATNWGMWGSSNPDNEDNWWYDYLHTNPSIEAVSYAGMPVIAAQMRAFLEGDDAFDEGVQIKPNAKYFLQPSGFSPMAENLENLPGKAKYYEDQAKNKSKAWVKQFIEAEWGYSVAGKPVVPTFNPTIHVSPLPLRYNKHLPLIVGLDPGIGGSALIFGQEDLHGRLLVLGELIQQGYGAQRIINDRLRPYVRTRFPEAQIVIAPDPAAANRAQTDEKSVVDTFKRHYRVVAESNNRLPLRLEAIEHYSTRLTDVGPALLIDAAYCPMLIRALKGGWRYALDNKHGQIKGAEPEKNPYSHPGDAFGYLSRYFHRGAQRSEKYGGARKFTPPTKFGAGYNFR